ncbi:unnamed protein product, partial [Brassica oleracea var. botrytis]
RPAQGLPSGPGWDKGFAVVGRGGLNPAKRDCEGTVQSLEAPEPELSQHGDDSFDRRDGARLQDQMRSVSPTEAIMEREMDKTGALSQCREASERLVEDDGNASRCRVTGERGDKARGSQSGYFLTNTTFSYYEDKSHL